MIQTHYDNLSASAQQRLKGISDAKIDPLKLPRGYLGGPITGIVFGIFGALVTYLVAMDGLHRKMRPDEVTTAGIMAFVSGAILIGSFLSMRRRKASAVKSFWYVHPSYLIDADFGNITAYPLLHLNDVKLTHHITNGVYSYTDVAMNFTGKMINLNYPGREASAEFAKAMLKYSDQVRFLEKQGNLQSAPEHDLFLSLNKNEVAGSKWYLEWLASGAAAGVLGYILLPAMHNSAADHQVFEYDCENARPSTKTTADAYNQEDPYRYDYGSIEYGCRNYIEEFPDGAHVEEADNKLFEAAKTSIRKLEDYKKLLPNGKHIGEVDAAIAALYNQANEKYKTTAKAELDPVAPDGIKAMSQVIETLRDSKTSKVYIKYSNIIDFDGKLQNPLHGTVAELTKRYNDLTIDAVEPSFTPELNSSREANITNALTSTFGEIIPEEIMRFEPLPDGGAVPADAVVVFDIQYVIFPAPDAVFTSKSNRYKGSFDVRFDWTFTIQLPKKTDAKPFTFTTTSIAPDDLSSEGETTFYGAMARTVFLDFGEHLKLIFGFPGKINTIGGLLPPSGTTEGSNGEETPLKGKKGKKK